MPIDASIPLSGKTPDGITTLGQMLNIQAQQQALKNSAQAYEQGAVNLEKSRATLQPEIEKSKAGADLARTQADKGKYEYTRQQATDALTEAAGLYSDKRLDGTPDEQSKAILEAQDRMKQKGIPAAQAARMTAQLFMDVDKPGMVRQHLKNFMGGNQGAQGQMDTFKPAGVSISDNQRSRVVNTNPMAGAVGETVPGTDVQLQLGPGTPIVGGPEGRTPGYLGPQPQEAPFMGQYSGPPAQIAAQIAAIRDPALQAQARQAHYEQMVRGGGTQRPGFVASGPPMPTQQDATSIPVLETERNQARNLQASAPMAHYTNRGILEELDKVISTGATGGVMARAASMAGAAGMKVPETAASAYDLIGKYTERNALEAAKAMGPGTNAGLEAAIKANGSAAYNPTALKKITKLNDAIVSGAELYSPGLEKAIAAHPDRNFSVLAKRQFDQQWAQNFDPRIMELENAAKAGNKAEIEALKKSLGPDGIRELLQKAQNLKTLSTQGALGAP